MRGIRNPGSCSFRCSLGCAVQDLRSARFGSRSLDVCGCGGRGAVPDGDVVEVMIGVALAEALVECGFDLGEMLAK